MPRPGRYKIRRKIADGGMAELFLATQHGAEGFERPVVLKRILAALVADPQFRNMMIDEAHVAMSLNHSNVVQVLDLGQSKGRYFLVLEYVDGWDLNQILNRQRAAELPLPPEIALFVAAEVCRALSYAHAKTRDGKHLGIVHRDISPHNVLVSEQGEVKLTDFGIAKALGRRERTGAGVIKGKLAFMSPEQASGAELDARSDLFSVGTMVYLMITGRRPFEAPTDLEAILRVRQCDFPPPEAVKPDLPPRLAEVIKRAMRLAPAERYQSAEEMLIDIEAIQRSVFQPAGQTELKRWLAELQRKDGLLPIGRAAPPPALNGENDHLDLVEGEDLVFDDSQVVEAEQTVASGPPVHLPVSPPPLPVPPPLPADAATPATPPPTRRSVGLLLGVGLAAAGGTYWFLARAPAPRPGTARPGTEPPPEATPEPAGPAPAAAEPAPAEPEPAPAEPEPAPAEPPAAEQRSTTAEADPEKEDEDEEEALLKRSEPDPEAQVIGEESAPPPRKPARPRPPAPSAPSEVSVKIVSRPEGAVIRLKDRVFGRAPMNLRFRPGITYELSFVKTGYRTASKRFTVTGRKNQVVSVSLQKLPAKKKKESFFRRLFGG